MAREIGIRTAHSPETEPNQTDELFQELHEYYTQTLPEQGFEQDKFNNNEWIRIQNRKAQKISIENYNDILSLCWHNKNRNGSIRLAYELVYRPAEKRLTLYDHTYSFLDDQGTKDWSLTNISPTDFEIAITIGLFSPEVLFRYESTRLNELFTKTITKIKEVAQLFETPISDILNQLSWHEKMQFLTPEFIAVASPQTIKAVIEAVKETTTNTKRKQMNILLSVIELNNYILNKRNEQES